MQPIALVPRGLHVAADEMARVASAIQVQLTRDFAPAWGIDAVCAAYPSVETVPAGYWFVLVVPDANGRAGFHAAMTPTQPPFAVVQHAADAAWSIAASHEIIEMLVDPRGDRLVKGPDPLGTTGQVDYLLEICDSCQGPTCSYQVDHNHSAAVADFCLPSFYGLGTAGPPYSKRANVRTAFAVESGGVLSFRAADNNWFQLQAVGGPPRIVPVDTSALLGALGNEHNLRGTLDRLGRRYAGPPVGKSRNPAFRRYAEIRKVAAAKVATQSAELEARMQGLVL